MSNELPEDLERLLEGERARAELAPDALDAAWSALQANVLKVDAGAPPDAGPPPAAPPPAPPTSLLPGTATWAGRALLAGATAVVFGTGVFVGRATAPPPPSATPIVMVAPPPTGPVATVMPIAIESAVPAAPSASVRAPTAASASGVKRSEVPPAASSAPVAASTLADERALVEGARTALLRGRAADALSLAQKHESSFPDGGLAEDRDFLIVSALHDLGRTGESRAKAVAFLARYPKSALRGTVESIAR